MAQLRFDARTVTPDPGTQDPMPAGWYNVVIVQSELKPTSDGNGQRLNLVFQVIDGQYKDRKIFEGLNLQNASALAVEIAYKQLSAICHAIGHLMVDDSSELHHKPLKVKVKVVPATSQYEPKNEIKAYKNINEIVAPAGAGAGLGNPFAPPPAIPAAAMPPGPGTWVPPAAPAQAAPQAPQAAPAPAYAPPAAAQPWAAAPAPAAAAPAAAPVAAPQPPWAGAPAVPAPAPAAAPQLQAPPGYAPPPAPVAAAPAAPVAYAPPAGAAPVQPPWATAPAQ